ncbi:hypothetical protein [Nonomuraea sp. NPDC002799]
MPDSDRCFDRGVTTNPQLNTVYEVLTPFRLLHVVQEDVCLGTDVTVA